MLRRFMLLAQRGQKAASSGRGAPQKDIVLLSWISSYIESFTQLFNGPKGLLKGGPGKIQGLAAAVVNIRFIIFKDTSA